ncbi:hypothetical protein PYCCODRAFT_1437132 [Trametes coccinea BRFM310]|uniref:Uncharacterized protein n=1 Tax=Trametes coccinea (strain BRFM310) TaxID=1353009 RepID=A0A1Y2ILG5_TRAC3|nr:hypothetical protein PYCCODRAFT_1437132 [Trametes coccinea BRFM310]
MRMATLLDIAPVRRQCDVRNLSPRPKHRSCANAKTAYQARSDRRGGDWWRDMRLWLTLAWCILLHPPLIATAGNLGSHNPLQVSLSSWWPDLDLISGHTIVPRTNHCAELYGAYRLACSS